MKRFIIINLLSYIITIVSLFGQSYSKFGIDTTGNNIPKGLALNSIAPDFTAKDQHGKAINLYNILKNKKVVLFFYRGNWNGSLADKGYPLGDTKLCDLTGQHIHFLAF